MKIETEDVSKVSDFQRYILHSGRSFSTEEELKAGYGRYRKACHDILLTEDEFIIEADNCYETETLKEVYSILTGLVKQKKMRAGDVYDYAHYQWCLTSPEAIVAYEKEFHEWVVNNCDVEISETKAKNAINLIWDLEIDLIEMIGIPYFYSTDWQFIRFNYGGSAWLWKDGELYPIVADESVKN